MLTFAPAQKSCATLGSYLRHTSRLSQSAKRGVGGGHAWGLDSHRSATPALIRGSPVQPDPSISCSPSGLQRREGSFSSECARGPVRRPREASAGHTVPAPWPPVQRAQSQSPGSPSQEHRVRPGGGSNRESSPPAALRPPPQGSLLIPALGAGTGKGREGPGARVHKCARASVPGRGPRAAGRMLTRARDVRAGTGGRRQNLEGWLAEDPGGEGRRAEEKSRAEE